MSGNFRKKNAHSHTFSIRFGTGSRQKRAKSVMPVFLPFSGCPMHCVYCAQDRQTGSTAPSPVAAIIADAEKALNEMPPCAEFGPRELAFYGGTFTALPAEERRACLALLERARTSGRITHARCSTRPDALAPAVLDELHDAGISLIELGIQSFDSTALSASRRGYSGEAALEACRIVQEAGFELGIQLLPGMPGCTPEVFLKDAEQALALRPSCLRFYPCLVPEGTVLARWLAEGRHAPWTLEQTVAVLGRALCRAWQESVPVIRLSVAPEPAFDAAVLAGPRHPALGALIQAEALLCAVQDAAAKLGRPPLSLVLPRSCQGFIYGERGALKPRWAALGLTPEHILFKDVEQAELQG
jgi:histone acetyltransferase (RNA polymerase elongator complex component)